MWNQARCWIGGIAVLAMACGGMAGAPAAARAGEPDLDDLPYSAAPPPPAVMAASEWNAAHRRSDRPLVVYAAAADTCFWALFVAAIAVLFARRRHSGVRSTT